MIGLPEPLGCRSRAVLPSAFAYIHANSEGTSISTTCLLFSVPHSAWWSGLLHAYRPPHYGGDCRPHYLDQRAEEFAWVTRALRASPLRRQLQQLGRVHFQCLGELPGNLQADIGLSRLEQRQVRPVSYRLHKRVPPCSKPFARRRRATLAAS